jgi:hypothetical protein
MSPVRSMFTPHVRLDDAGSYAGRATAFQQHGPAVRRRRLANGRDRLSTACRAPDEKPERHAGPGFGRSGLHGLASLSRCQARQCAAAGSTSVRRPAERCPIAICRPGGPAVYTGTPRVTRSSNQSIASCAPATTTQTLGGAHQPHRRSRPRRANRSDTPARALAFLDTACLEPARHNPTSTGRGALHK